MFIDSRNVTAVCDEATECVSPDQIAAAQKTTCSFVARQVLLGEISSDESASAAEELMMALGIHPSQEFDEATAASLPATTPHSASIRGAHLS